MYKLFFKFLKPALQAGKVCLNILYIFLELLLGFFEKCIVIAQLNNHLTLNSLELC